jgi:phage terminase large subunit
MTLHPKQKQIVNSNKRFRVVIAGRRGGKTVLSINELLGKAFFTENGLVVYIAPTNEDVRDIIWRELKNMARAVVVKQNDVKMEMEIQNKYGGTSLIKTASWESIINKGRLRGQKFHFVVMDEVSSYKAFWVGWEEIIRPTLTDYKGDVLFIGTPKGYNHFYDLYNYEVNDEDFGSFHFTSYDNPYIDPKEIDKARGQMTVDRFSQEYMGEFKKMEGLVYPEFSRLTHLIDDKDLEKIAITEIRVGVDFGYTNPAAVIKIIKDRDNNYYIVDEFYKTKQSTDKLIEMCKIFKAQKVYPDTAEPDRIDLMKKEGLNIMPTSKDIDAGIDAVRQLLEQKRLFIHKKCFNTINEFESYHFPEFKLEKNKPEKPYDDNNHALDAIRYALFPVIKQGNNFEAKIFIPQI